MPVLLGYLSMVHTCFLHNIKCWDIFFWLLNIFNLTLVSLPSQTEANVLKLCAQGPFNFLTLSYYPWQMHKNHLWFLSMSSTPLLPLTHTPQWPSTWFSESAASREKFQSQWSIQLEITLLCPETYLSKFCCFNRY